MNIFRKSIKPCNENSTTRTYIVPYSCVYRMYVNTCMFIEVQLFDNYVFT